MNPSESDPDYLLVLKERPELIEGELQRIERRRSICRWRTALGLVLLLACLVLAFWMEHAYFLTAPALAAAFNLGEGRGEARRLAQLRKWILFLRESARDEVGGAAHGKG